MQDSCSTKQLRSQETALCNLVAQACDPANYAKVHKRPRCPAAGCRDKLTTINRYRCKTCGATVCLRHRFASDHQCPGRPGAPRRGW